MNSLLLKQSMNNNCSNSNRVVDKQLLMIILKIHLSVVWEKLMQRKKKRTNRVGKACYINRIYALDSLLWHFHLWELI